MKLTDARILVVDDEPMLLEIVAKWLRAVGCLKVLTAANGQAALDVLELEPIDLLLTDVRMPVMDGVALVRHLAEIGKTLPGIVFVSGFGDVDRREMYALGVEAFVAKPFDRPELLSILERAVAERSSLWHTEMAAAPRQSLVIQADRIDRTAGSDTIGIGRGGLSVFTPEQIGTGKISFRILLDGSAATIAGQGYVRWTCRADAKAGIELAFLDPASRIALTEAIISTSPHSFIPGS